jgi:hypothetical protein
VRSPDTEGRNPAESGQALVLVLLALAVVLTIVLFILSRSITDISVSSSQSQSVSAFSAAEAGVEQALVGSATGTPMPVGVGGASYTANVTDVAKGATSFIYPIGLNSGDDMTLWLKSQDSSSDFTGSNLKICWGSAGTLSNSDTTPAIEVVLFHETAANTPSTTEIFRAAFDPYSPTRTNGFSAPDNISGACSVGGQAFQFQKTLNLAPNPQFVFVRMFYNTDTAQFVAFDSTDTHVFPTQGIVVDSTGLAGQSTRRVSVFQGWPEIPDPFRFAIYSINPSTGLIKN